MRASAFHMVSDALASLAVVVAGVLILTDPGLRWADPLSSLAVAGLILVGAYRLLRASVDVLLESAPADVDVGALSTSMGADPGVAEVHDLHVWSLSSEVRALSAHIVLTGHPTLEEAQAIGDRVKSGLAAPYGIAHATLELECERCAEGEIDPCLMDALPGGARPRPSDAH
jgi:cobalt-zinc-cadmium efflux system protein